MDPGPVRGVTGERPAPPHLHFLTSVGATVLQTTYACGQPRVEKYTKPRITVLDDVDEHRRGTPSWNTVVELYRETRRTNGAAVCIVADGYKIGFQLTGQRSWVFLSVIVVLAEWQLWAGHLSVGR